MIKNALIDLPELEVEQKSDTSLNRKIVVHNDDHNPFEWVIMCFVDILGHSTVQAEQCAHLIHFKGKCSVKSGSFDELKPLKDGLVDRGLSAVIE